MYGFNCFLSFTPLKIGHFSPFSTVIVDLVCLLTALRTFFPPSFKPTSSKTSLQSLVKQATLTAASSPSSNAPSTQDSFSIDTINFLVLSKTYCASSLLDWMQRWGKCPRWWTVMTRVARRLCVSSSRLHTCTSPIAVILVPSSVVEVCQLSVRSITSRPCQLRRSGYKTLEAPSWFTGSTVHSPFREHWAISSTRVLKAKVSILFSFIIFEGCQMAYFRYSMAIKCWHLWLIFKTIFTDTLIDSTVRFLILIFALCTIFLLI